MSWETVSAAIRFWPDGDGWNTNGTNSGSPFNAAQRSQILGLIQQLYFGSSYAQALLGVTVTVHSVANYRGRPFIMN